MKIPAKYAERVSATDKDEDGYWIWLKFPWVDREGCWTIREDTAREALAELRDTVRPKLAKVAK